MSADSHTRPVELPEQLLPRLLATVRDIRSTLPHGLRDDELRCIERQVQRLRQRLAQTTGAAPP